MRQSVGIALVFSCVAHALLLVPFTHTGRGNATASALKNQSEFIIAKILPQRIFPPTTSSQSSAIQAKPEVSAHATVTATVPNFDLAKALPEIVTIEADQPPAISGLGGSSDVIYWSFEDVDQGALLLAEWPENLIIAPWPSERPVAVEVWVNPDGGLANLNFPQEDLPVSIKMALFDSIHQYGFKPAIKDGAPVGNHRLLELLLTETSVPALAIR